MPVPSSRNKILPVRGNIATLQSNVGSLAEGEICYALDEDQYYQIESGALVAVGATKAQGLLADTAVQPTDSIDVLADVDTTTVAPTTGQFLEWDGTNWVPGSASALQPGVTIEFAPGTAAAPGLYPTGDTDTGIYSPGADTVGVSTAGTERLRIDSSGRLLWGSPTSVPVGGVTAGVEINATGTTNGASLSIARFNNDVFGPQVNIGKSRNTTTSAGAITQNNDELGRILFSGDDGTDLNTVAAGVYAYVDGTPGANAMPGRLVFGTTAVAGSAPTERMRIDSAGDLGIGTSSPSARLTVRQDGTGQNIQVWQSDLGVNDRNLTLLSPSSDSASEPFTFSTGNSLAVRIDASEAVRIDSAGNLGVGTTSPAANLHISGTGSPALRIQDADGTNQYLSTFHNNGLTTFDSRDNTSDGSFRFRGGSTTNEFLRIDSAGRLLVGTSSTSQYTTALLQGNSADTTGGGIIKLARGDSTPGVGAFLGEVAFSDSGHSTALRIAVARDGGTWTSGVSQPTRLVVQTTADGASSPTERLRIDSAGNVGIGTSSPEEILDVDGPIVWRGALATSKTSAGALDRSGNDLRIRAYGATAGTGQLVFRTGGGGGSVDAEAMRIDSSGRLLVGTSSSTQNARAIFQGYHADSTGPGIIRLAAGNSAPPFDNDLGSIEFCDSSHLRAARIQVSRDGGTWTSGSSQPTRLVFSTTADGVASTTERMRIDKDGHVGIGTTNPAYELVVASSGIASLQILSGGSTNQSRLMFADAADIAIGRIIYDHSNNSMQLFTNNSERLRITSAGSVGIGTSSPLGKCHAVDSNSASYSSANMLSTLSTIRATNSNTTAGIDSGITFEATGDGAQPAQGVIKLVHTGNGAGALALGTKGGGTSTVAERMRIDNSGTVSINGIKNFDTYCYLEGDTSKAGTFRINYTENAATSRKIQHFYRANTEVGSISITNAATSYTTTSDYRLKENVVAVTDGIARLKQLKPARFNFIVDPDRTVDGFIAHEVQGIVPEAITGEKDAVDEDGNPIHQGIDQSKLVPLLTAALQEAMSRIETLEAKVAALEAN